MALIKICITELTLIHKNIRSVRNSHAQELTLILKIICQYHIKHILMSPIKTIMPVFKILTYIITSITASSIRQCIPNHLVSYNVSLIELPHTVYFQLIGPIRLNSLISNSIFKIDWFHTVHSQFFGSIHDLPI